MFKTCKGLATQHVTVNTDEVCSRHERLADSARDNRTNSLYGRAFECCNVHLQVSSEIMAVIKGKSHVKQVQRHGWKGSITFADGMTSLHTRTAED